MLTKSDYLKQVLQVARTQGYKVETSGRSGLEQIDFGNKKLHSEHLEKLYPDILQPDAEIPALIDKVAPGRPCAHKPMREIIQEIKSHEK